MRCMAQKDNVEMTCSDRMSGNALRRAQAFLGYTQEEMARAMGISIATYQRRVALAEEYIPLAEGTHVRELTKIHAPWEE